MAIVPSISTMKGPSTRVTALIASLVLTVLIPRSPSIHAQDRPRPTFGAGVALVPITAVVRDSRNRMVRNLVRDDFEVLEQGVPRRIVEFRAREDAPVSAAFLFDTSGSMPVASNLEKGKVLVERFLSQVDPVADTVALFTFDSVLRQEVPFTNDRKQIRGALGRMTAWGLTSLYDAIAETARQLEDRPSDRRAVVVITDGADTSSTLTPPEVSGLASAIDVPVYVIAVVSPLDHPGNTAAVVPEEADGDLSNLAYWTGGDLLYVSAPEQAGVVTKELLATMRQQYFLAIEASTAPGWYRLEVRTKRGDLSVRSRSGYFATQPPRSSGTAKAGNTTDN
jgi:Ca-activated chloride channel family protein